MGTSMGKPVVLANIFKHIIQTKYDKPPQSIHHKSYYRTLLQAVLAYKAPIHYI